MGINESQSKLIDLVRLFCLSLYHFDAFGQQRKLADEYLKQIRERLDQLENDYLKNGNQG